MIYILIVLFALLTTVLAQYVLNYELKNRQLCKKAFLPITSFIIIFLLNIIGYFVVFCNTKINFFVFICIGLIISCLVVLMLIDYLCFELPDKIVLIVGILALIYKCITKQFFSLNGLLQVVLGFFAASGVLYLIGILSNGNMGGGDIKLAAACGIWLGPIYVLIGMFVGTLVASLWYIVLLILRKKDLKSMIPFGPFLIIGFFIMYVWGHSLLDWYIGLIIH